ncbi:MAG: hypothetical protein PWP45_1167 [Tepidanaerobacteraceae bacterium]|nr:hypothetical protein [Tepidanaerobacteraceae bacterium]
MTKFIGHGMLEIYSKELDIGGEEKLSNVVRFLNIPENLQEHIVFIKGGRTLNGDDLIKDGDEVHFYIVPFGG